MHAAILKLRMVPVAQVFRSFPRLVRDTSQRLKKKVGLVTNGETTEADKIIVDRLFEPLLHVVRNALDHGIESPEQRLAAGKAERAIVSMRASRAGDRLSSRSSTMAAGSIRRSCGAGRRERHSRGATKWLLCPTNR